MESTHYGVTLGHLEASQLTVLLDEAAEAGPEWALLPPP